MWKVYLLDWINFFVPYNTIVTLYMYITQVKET
jgi:hypothetical protein